MFIFLSTFIEDKDIRKFELLFDTYKDGMFSIAYGILKDSYAAEDAVQESFISIAKHFYAIGDINSKKTKNYVYIVARNKAIDFYRKLKRDRSFYTSDFDFLSYDNIDLKLISDEKIKKITEAITHLPIIYASTLELYIYHELSRKEIADLTGVSYNAVKLRIQRAKKLIRIYLGE